MNGTHGRQTRASDRTAFDAWLRRTLEERYRHVLAEPVPADWLSMIEEQTNPEAEPACSGGQHEE